MSLEAKFVFSKYKNRFTYFFKIIVLATLQALAQRVALMFMFLEIFEVV